MYYPKSVPNSYLLQYAVHCVHKTNQATFVTCRTSHLFRFQVRVVLSGLNGFHVSDLSNATARSAWINMQLKRVQDTFADGINIDIEEPVKNGSQEMTLLTQFVGEIYSAFKKANMNYQVSV